MTNTRRIYVARSSEREGQRALREASSVKMRDRAGMRGFGGDGDAIGNGEHGKHPAMREQKESRGEGVMTTRVASRINGSTPWRSDDKTRNKYLKRQKGKFMRQREVGDIENEQVTYPKKDT